MQKQEIKLLVFDWDGTLADSEQFIVNAMQAAIEQLDLDMRTRDEIRNIIGLGLMEAADVLFPGLNQIEHERLADSYRKHYSSSAKGKTALFPDVIDTLYKLKEQDYKLAIATGKSRKGLDNSLQDTGIRSFFHTTRCADETFSKPHPRMLMEIMDQLLIEPENTLMIGDSEYDLLMAKNTSVAPVAVSYGTQTRERLLEHKPLTCLDNLNELPDWLAYYID
jgi:phosphoglycolate phosphatase